MLTPPPLGRAARPGALGYRLGALAVISLVVAACTAGAATPPPAAPTAGPVATPADRWLAFFQQTPYPFSSPLPSPADSPLEGTYVKVEPKPGTPVPCFRCPDYAPEGGLWKLNFDDGIYRILHDPTGWRSLGSFTVDGDQLQLFNDPNCQAVTGRYRWRREAGALILEAVDDPCAINLRAANLGARPWAACQPPNDEAAITDHWPKPAGCGK